ncbi:hypothetical protein AS026_30870 [Rhizobium altiplani]|uniref:DUF937 domain-containing protein n=1 Tax=Rhizobium altiplani TaxID=1864509 RepID=A0A125Q9K9_9HYPH|nr:YidB family protein [Rhizobium altiplani]KWV57707.1 hypothetical protein AS026_30870 [Rhizobium altiplani]
MMSGPLKALLSALVVAGYQNRDKIGEFLRGIQNPQTTDGNASAGQPGSPKTAGGQGAIFSGPGGLGDLLGGLTTGGILSGGLGDLLKTFQQNGHEDKAHSWVQPGPNVPIDNDQLSEALGPDVIKELAAKTGLSPQEILDRLSRDLPTAVDDLTPNGRVPDAGGEFLASASAATTSGKTQA